LFGYVFVVAKKLSQREFGEKNSRQIKVVSQLAVAG